LRVGARRRHFVRHPRHKRGRVIVRVTAHRSYANGDGESLLRVLRDEVIPLYYNRDRDGRRRTPRTPPTISAPKSAADPRPTHDDVAARAYQLFVRFRRSTDAG